MAARVVLTVAAAAAEAAEAAAEGAGGVAARPKTRVGPSELRAELPAVGPAVGAAGANSSPLLAVALPTTASTARSGEEGGAYAPASDEVDARAVAAATTGRRPARAEPPLIRPRGPPPKAGPLPRPSRPPAQASSSSLPYVSMSTSRSSLSCASSSPSPSPSSSSWSATSTDPASSATRISTSQEPRCTSRTAYSRFCCASDTSGGGSAEVVGEAIKAFGRC